MKKLIVLSITLLLSSLSVTAQAMEGENWQRTEQPTSTDQTTQTNWLAKLPCDIFEHELLAYLPKKDRGRFLIACLTSPDFTADARKRFQELLEIDGAGKLAPKQKYMNWLMSDLVLYIISLLPPTERLAAAFGILNQFAHKHEHQVGEKACKPLTQMALAAIQTVPAQKRYSSAKTILATIKKMLEPDQYTQLQAIITTAQDNGGQLVKAIKHGRGGFHRWAQKSTVNIPSAIQKAINQGVDLNVQDESGNSALILILQSKLGSSLEQFLIESLLENGTDPNLQNNAGLTALMYAAQHAEPLQVQTLLKFGAKPNLKVYTNQASAGFTALHFAARHKCNEVMKQLIAAGADVNAQNENGTTPLILSAYQRDGDGIQLLLDNGAHLKLTEKFGPSDFSRTALDIINHMDKTAEALALKKPFLQKENEIANAFINAANKNDLQTIQTLLKKHGPDVDAQSYPEAKNALMVAAQQGATEYVHALLEGGAQTEITDRDGATALMLAAQAGHEAVVKLLINHGAYLKIKDKHGQTAADYAKQHDHSNVVKLIDSANISRELEKVKDNVKNIFKK